MSTAPKLPDSRTSGPQEAILFVSRTSIRPVIRQELKNIGITDVVNVDTVNQCIEELVRRESAMLIIDWEHGSETVNTALRAAQGAFNVDTRPIFLIAAEINRDIVSISTEYNVARVHTGEISRGAIQGHLEAVVGHDGDDLQSELTRIADARARGDWDMSGVLLLELLTRHPDNQRIACELAENFIHTEEWSKAEAAIEQAMASGAGSLRLSNLRARCLMKRQEFEEAAEILSQCKLVNPHNVDRLIDLGKVLMNLGRVQEALENFDEALELDSTNRDALSGKAQCTLMEGDVNEALALLRQLSGPRELASVFNNAAILCIRQGRFEHGTSLYKTAIGTTATIKRICSRLLYNLGIAYHKSSRADEALIAFEEACRADPLFDNARTNATVIAARLGRRADIPASAAGKAAGKKTGKVIDEFTEDFAEEKFSKKS